MREKVEIDDNNNLHCPRCGGEFMHQKKYHFDMRKEDQASIAFTCEEDGGLKAEHKHNGIAGRRQSMEITFRCETCGKDSKLLIMQHKGSTIIEFEEL